MPLPLSALANAQPALVVAERRLRGLAAAKGITYDLADFGGIRSYADTVKILGYREREYAKYVAALKAKDPAAKPLPIDTWRRIRPFESSHHNYGAAFDVRVVTYPKGRTAAWALAQLQQLAPSAGLRSGVSFNDPPHMELAITLAEARRRWEAMGGKPGVAPGGVNTGPLPSPVTTPARPDATSVVPVFRPPVPVSPAAPTRAPAGGGVLAALVALGLFVARRLRR